MDTKQLISSIDEEIERLTQARNLLSDQKAPRSAKSAKPTERKQRRALSPEARARIAAAQKKRWAKSKAAAKTAAKAVAKAVAK